MIHRAMYIITTAILWAICTSLLAGCITSKSANSDQTSPTPEPCSTIQTNTLSDNLPIFLEKVSPSPDSVIKLECYIREIESNEIISGVYATISVGKMVEIGDNLEVHSLRERVNIFIDTEQVSDVSPHWFIEMSRINISDAEGNVIISHPGPRATIGLPATLTTGKHTATVQVRKTSGKVLEYSWTFTIEP